jgi:hypothetical protein
VRDGRKGFFRFGFSRGDISPGACFAGAAVGFSKFRCAAAAVCCVRRIVGWTGESVFGSAGSKLRGMLLGPIQKARSRFFGAGSILAIVNICR